MHQAQREAIKEFWVRLLWKKVKKPGSLGQEKDKALDKVI